MVAEFDQVDLFVFGVPVAADALEAPGPVVERVGGDGDRRLFDGHEAPVHEGEPSRGESRVGSAHVVAPSFRLFGSIVPFILSLGERGGPTLRYGS